jgi:hypothetical protein
VHDLPPPRAPTLDSLQPSLAFSPFLWRQKIIIRFFNFSFIRLRTFFSVVALKKILRSGKKLSAAIIRLYIKGETASAINLRAVPSLSIFQEISDFTMGGLELCQNVPLIPPVTILAEPVRDNLRR